MTTDDNGGPLEEVDPTKHPLSESIEYSGPLPPASELQKYDQVLPGSAERILSMAEKQSGHRRGLEKSLLEAGIDDARRGHYLGFAVVVGLILGAVVSAYLDQPVIGAALVGTSALGVVSAFIRGRSGGDSGDPN